jgi:plasmid rolling circle replication initiator protein Rep
MRNSLQNSNLSERENVAEKRIAFGVSSALALRRALIHNEIEEQEPWGLAKRIWTCSERENHFVGDDLHNRETGELYAGNGNLWGCGSKLCPSCVAKSSIRSRKELTLALKNQKLFTGESYQLITLTMPNPNLPLLLTRSIMDRAWSLFRKRDYFIEKIRGGSKSEEFTITENGYHYHFHLLCVTRFLSFDKFRREWTECLQIAFSEQNLHCEFKTADNLAMVNIKKLNSSANGLKGAILEVCKYVTKSDSWEKISEKDLLDIANVKRFPRMFELFRLFRTQRNVNVKLDINSGFNFRIIYSLLSIVSESFRSKDKKRMRRAFVFLLRFCRGQEVFDFDGDTILDTKEISDGEKFSRSANLPEKVPKRRKEVGWREYILKNGLERYFEKLAEQVGKTREARKYFLSLKYEYATFHTLDGVSFSFEQL